MKKATLISTIFCMLCALACAGPESLPSGKEMKEVAPAPPPPACDWTGFYIGLNVGGQFGHSEDLDHNYNAAFAGSLDKPWGYSESGVIAGGQIGYNWQWHCLVLGPEFDVGYMKLEGRGTEPGSPGGDTRGESDSDFYTTFRGRIGVAFDWQGCWLIYGTGGAIGLNYTTRQIDDCITAPCGVGLVDARQTNFDWGYTVGGGIERILGRHWSVKAEYLYFSLSDQDSTGQIFFVVRGTTIPGGTAQWQGETAGHILRAGLNYKF